MTLNTNNLANSQAERRGCKYPSKLAVRCGQCQHQAVVHAFIDKPPKLKCSRCGSRDAVVLQRDRTRAWSRQRRGK